MSDFIIVQTTTDSQQAAEKIATDIADSKLAACTQIEGPITSVYQWKEKLEKSVEWKCSFKTSKALFQALEKKLKQIHSYETPEIVAVEIVSGSHEYLSWLKDELGD